MGTSAKPSKETMQGNYCRLEYLDVDNHGSKLFEALKFSNVGETWTYLPFGPYETYHDFKKWLTEISLEKMFFTVIDCKTNTPQGMASYHDIDIFPY